METSISVSQYIPNQSRKNTSKSLKVSKTNFRNEIVMPIIYDIQNIKIVIDNNYRVKPRNNVLQSKKQRVQKKVQQIVSKKFSQVPKVQAMLSQKLSRPKTAPKTIQGNYSDIQNKKDLTRQDFCLNFDERINQMGITLQQGTQNARQRFEQVQSKLKHIPRNKKQHQLQNQVKFYMNQISPIKKGKRIAVKQPNAKEVKGYLHQLQKKSRRSKSLIPNKSQIYQKSVSTKQSPLKRNKSLISNRLTRYSDQKGNIHTNQNKQIYKDKCNDILEMIEDKCSHYRRDSQIQKMTLKKMRTLWNTKMNNQQQQQKQIQLFDLLPETLQVLEKQRKKQNALKQIDRQYIN